MILGAGIYQVPAILKAKEMGLNTIVCSNNTDDPGMSIADTSYNISTIENEEILNVAKKEKINGIITIASEASAPTVSYVANKLHLSGYDYAITKTIFNKYLLRQYLKENGFKVPKYGKAKTISEALSIFSKISHKAIMKPLESSGSRGVHLIVREEDIIKHFDESSKYSFGEKGVIIEEFIEGVDVGAECLIYERNLIFFNIYNRYLNEYFVPISKSLPDKLNEKKKAEVRELITECIRILKLDSGALNLQLVITDNNSIIIEMGARLGGCCLTELMKYSTGADTIKSTISMALGQKPDVRVTKNDCYGVRIIGSNKDGILTYISPEDVVKEKLCGSIIDLKYDYNSGDIIHKFNQGSHRIGHIIFKGSSTEDIENKYKVIDEILTIKVSDGKI